MISVMLELPTRSKMTPQCLSLRLGLRRATIRGIRVLKLVTLSFNCGRISFAGKPVERASNYLHCVVIMLRHYSYELFNFKL